MSCKINLQGLPSPVYGDILTADSMSMNRTPGKALSTLTFPKSKSSLWDPSPTGDAVGLHLCYYRNPHLRVLEKALRLAHRHAQQKNKPTFCCFLLGSVSVDEDEEGVTLTLDRFDPGRDEPGTRVPSLVLPGDVVVPVQLVLQRDKDPLVRPSDLSNTFKALQQACSGGEVADLSQLLGVRGQVSCSQQGDQLGFSLRWLAASCASGFDVVGVRPLPIIPTALARSLSGLSSPGAPRPSLSNPGAPRPSLSSSGSPRPSLSNPGAPRPSLSNPGAPRPSLSSSGPLRPSLPRPLKQQRGFLTMDQTRKLLLLLESDPKACSLPLVGVWLSGVVQPSNPQVWAWCLRFFHSSALHDRVLSEQGWFLLVLFSAVPSQARFYQCRSTGKQSAHMDYLLLSCSQDVTLFKHVEPAEGHCLQGDFSVDKTTQRDPLQALAAHPVSSLLVASADQDSGVEDEDLSPRPSPSPHAPTQQTRGIRPSVPELSLLVDASLPPTPQPGTSRRSCSPTPEPRLPDRPYLHSTPAATLSQSSGGFWTNKTPPTLILAQPSPVSTSTQLGPSSCPRSPPHPDPGGLQTSQSPALPCSCLQPGPSAERGALPSDAYQILMAQERQLRLLQAQIQMLLETQVRYQTPSAQTGGAHPSSPTPPPPTTASVAVGTGASLLWSSTVGPLTTLGRDTVEDQPSSPLSVSTQELHGTSGVESPVLGKSSSVLSNTSATQPDHHDVLPTLQLQVSSRLQASLSDHETPSSPSSSSSSSSSSSTSYYDGARSYRKQEVTGRFHKKQEVSDEKQPHPTLNTNPTASNLDSISPALVPSLAQTPRDPLLPGDLSPAETPRVPLLPGDRSPAQTPQIPRLTPDSSLTRNTSDPMRNGDHGLAHTPIHPLLFEDLSLTHNLREPLRSGGSVDLSLEANAIALRYLSDSQLSRLSVGRGGQAALSSPERSVLTPSNMSMATRGYMRRYGLIEEEEDEEEEEEEEGVTCTLLRTESSLPQSQLIRDLQPKLRLLAESNRYQDKENRPAQQRSPLGAGSVGNFLDVGRLRQLPKLF